MTCWEFAIINSRSAALYRSNFISIIRRRILPRGKIRITTDRSNFLYFDNVGFNSFAIYRNIILYCFIRIQLVNGNLIFYSKNYAFFTCDFSINSFKSVTDRNDVVVCFFIKFINSFRQGKILSCHF